MSNRRRLALMAPVLALGLVAGACSSDEAAEPEAETEGVESTTTSASVNEGETVAIDEFQYGPSSLTVATGDVVTWENDGDTRHTVTDDPAEGVEELFASGPIQPGETFVQTFSEPGTFDYFCSIHPDEMRASVTVE